MSPTEQSAAAAVILPLPEPLPAAMAAAIDAVFFEASATKSFASEEARAAFRERWLGRYLEQFAEHTFVAVAAGGRVLGYVTGALSDPAQDPRFADIAYFRDLAAETLRYPAHLHINLAADARNRGVGGRLIETFAAHARRAGAPGLHVVTAKASRNRSFYARHGFDLVAERLWNGHAVVLLGRML